MRSQEECRIIFESYLIFLSQDTCHASDRACYQRLRERPLPDVHKAPGGVVIQAYKTSGPEHMPPGMPNHEGVLFIPDADWDFLILNLITKMIAETPR